MTIPGTRAAALENPRAGQRGIAAGIVAEGPSPDLRARNAEPRTDRRVKSGHRSNRRMAVEDAVPIPVAAKAPIRADRPRAVANPGAMGQGIRASRTELRAASRPMQPSRMMPPKAVEARVGDSVVVALGAETREPRAPFRRARRSPPYPAPTLPFAPSAKSRYSTFPAPSVPTARQACLPTSTAYSSG